MTYGYEEDDYDQEKAWEEEQEYLASESAKAEADATAQGEVMSDRVQVLEKELGDILCDIQIITAFNVDATVKQILSFLVSQGLGWAEQLMIDGKPEGVKFVPLEIGDERISY